MRPASQLVVSVDDEVIPQQDTALYSTLLEKSGLALDIPFNNATFTLKGDIVQHPTAWRRPLFALIVTLLVVPNCSALKNDWTEVDNIYGHSRIKVWLFPDQTDGEKKFTGSFVGVTPDTLIIDADKPRNRLSISKQSIKRVGVGRRSANRAWYALSFLTIPLVYVSTAFVAAPSLMLVLGPRNFRTIYRNTGRSSAVDPNDGPPVELVKPDR